MMNTRNLAHTLIIGLPSSEEKELRSKLKNLREKLAQKTVWRIDYEDEVIEVQFDDSERKLP